jgi:ABC-type multidrug transport system ATPase subunit
MTYAIEVNSLSKYYAKTRALNEINLSVGRGELFGLIGADGAGKTTLIRILCSLLLPSSGVAKVMNYDTDKDFKSIRKIIGYMPGKFALYQDLTIKENLELFASIFGTSVRDNYEMIKPIYSQIEKFADRRAGDLSGGMKQKLALSCALIHKPEVLFLDEPTTGVDPVSRTEFWDMLSELKNYGISIFVSTPYMDEAKRCDRIALIQSGEILDVNTPSAVEASYPLDLYAVYTSKIYRTLQLLRSRYDERSVQTFGDNIHLSIKDSNENIEDIRLYLSQNGIDDVEIRKINAGIEDCFMYLMATK